LRFAGFEKRPEPIELVPILQWPIAIADNAKHFAAIAPHNGAVRINLFPIGRDWPSLDSPVKASKANCIIDRKAFGRIGWQCCAESVPCVLTEKQTGVKVSWHSCVSMLREEIASRVAMLFNYGL
jgi:hypothetical protein